MNGNSRLNLAREWCRSGITLPARAGSLLIIIAGGLVTMLPALAVETAVEFGEILRISPEGRLAMSPDLAVDDDGRAHILWVDKGADGKAPPAPTDPSEIESGPGVQHHAFDDLYYRQFSAGADPQLSKPVQVNTEPGEVWGFSVSKPQIAVGPDGTSHVLFTGNQDLGNDKSSVIARYTRSTDGGKSFEPVRTLNSPADNDLSAVMHGGFVAAHAFGTLLAARNGNVGVYWIDTRLMDESDTAGAVFYAISRDGGETFEADQVLFEENVCPCCQLGATEAGDAVFLTTRQVFDGKYRDATVALSRNAGSSFAAPVRVGEGRWEIEGCPLKRIDVAASGNNVYTASYTMGREPGGVYLSRSTDGGDRYDAPMAVHPDARVADAPSLSADSEGRVWLVWHAKTTGKRRLFLRVSTDGGASWSEPIEIPGPEGTAMIPEVAAMPDGTAYVVWQQSNTVYLTSVRLAPSPTGMAHADPPGE